MLLPRALDAFVVLASVSYARTINNTFLPIPDELSASQTTISASTGTTSLASMSSSALPSNVNQGVITLASRPPTCTGTSVPYTTNVVVQSWGMVMVDSNWWGSLTAAKWTFSTNTSGIYFANPYFTGGPDDGPTKPDLFPRTGGSSFSINLGGNSDPSTGRWGWEIGMLNSTSTNSTGAPPSLWNATSTPIDPDSTPPVWNLQIRGEGLCPHPIGNNSCGNDGIKLNADSWTAFGVDDWFNSWYKNNSDQFDSHSGMQTLFASQHKIAAGGCDFGSACQLLERCNDLADANSDPATASIVYLIWMSLQNLSDYFTNIKNAIGDSEVDQLTEIGQMALNFHNVHADIIPPAKEPPASQVSGIFGILSTIAGVLSHIPGVGTYGNVAEGIFEIGGKIADQAAKNEQEPVQVMPDAQYATDSSDAAWYLGNFTNQLSSTVSQAYDSVLNGGENITSILSGGAFVDRQLLQLDNTTTAENSQLWLENYMRLKIINSIWKQQNTFITFVPYGNVTQVDENVQTTFHEGDCINFNQGPLTKYCFQENSRDFGVLGSLGGMALIAFYDPNDPNNVAASDKAADKYPWGHVNLNVPVNGSQWLGKQTDPTSIWKISSSGQTYAFNAGDVMYSSVIGFVEGGFNWDGVSNTSLAAAQASESSTGFGLMSQVAGAQPSTPGMFNLPVCMLTDLSSLPNLWGQGGRPSGGNYCVCGDFADKNGVKFQDAVPPSLSRLSSSILMTDGSLTQCGL